MAGIIFNNWKAFGVVTVGSGRPISATVTGDANQDGNNNNDRLPGESSDSLLGPDYATTDLRLTRRIYAGDRAKLELMAESFNLLNRDNKRVQITQDVSPATRPSAFRRIRPLESISFLPNTAFPPAFCTPPMRMRRARSSSP